MSVVYETGTALHANDLIDKFRAFALARGWTINRHAVRSDGLGSGGWALNLQLGDVHAALYADLGAGSTINPGQHLGGYLYPAWDTGLGNMVQASRSALVHGNGYGSSQYVGYHFFSGTEYLHGVVEVVSGQYAHFGVGRIVRLGTINTGAYVHVLSWNWATGGVERENPLDSSHGVPWDSSVAWHSHSTIVRADSDAVSPRYLFPHSGLVDGLLGGLRPAAGPPDMLPAQQATASTITGRAPLWPMLVAARRGGTGLYSPLGHPRDLRWVRLDHLAPKDVITLGTEQWMVFPIIRRDGSAGQPNSGRLGMAYRRA